MIAVPNLFLAVSTYLVAREEVVMHLVAHRTWAAEGYRRGIMLVSGPQDPPIGGVMVFRAANRQKAEEFVASDPFTLAGVARYSVVGFEPTGRPWRSAAYESFDPS